MQIKLPLDLLWLMTSGSIHKLLGLDIGERRIGVALADSTLRIATPLTTLIVDGTELVRLQTLLLEHGITDLVVGLPRNMAGQETAQSKRIKEFASYRLQAFGLPIIFQDESATSVMAEERLKDRKKPFHKATIDAEAATIILQDYIEGGV